MLLALSLRNFVLVESLNLHFESDFTVLTGETGAGKSIILDALCLLLGDKADFSQIRHGENEAIISALFDISALPNLKAFLYEQGLISESDTELSIRRIIDIKGKSRNYINNQSATLAQLKQMGEQLINIHGQNEHHHLNTEPAQRQLLDAFADAKSLAEQVATAWQEWQSIEQRKQQAQEAANNILIEQERLQWQFDELSTLALQPNEWEALNQSHDRLAHAAELLQTADTVHQLIDGENGLQSQIHQAIHLLQPLASLTDSFQNSLNLLDSIEIELSELAANMRSTCSDTEIDEQLLQQQANRIQTLMSTARKYRIEPNELWQKQIDIQQQLNQIAADTDLEALSYQADQAKSNLMQLAQLLQQKRQQAANQLAQKVNQQLHGLAMPNAQFHIELIPSEIGKHGTERVQFQVAVNKGTPLRPMHKSASGGELSRINLALQVAISNYTDVPTLIFDEVDTGIGGAVADSVGKILRQLSQHHQVITITHLPQVAVYGHQHWQVQKYTQDNKTISEINILNHEHRINEIARMLGGETITPATQQHAIELLTLANKE